MRLLRFQFGLFLIGLSLLPIRLDAGLCATTRIWDFSQLAEAPVLVVGRVVSLDRANGQHFTGNPKRQPPPQAMTAEVEVLRFARQPTLTQTSPPRRLRISFVGRDGPDFAFCPSELPELEPGQVLLLPLSDNQGQVSTAWELAGIDGFRMTRRVAGNMGEPPPVTQDLRTFIIREVVNSLSRGDPTSRYTAAEFVADDADHMEPELSSQLKQSIGGDRSRWAQVLGNLLLTYPDRPLTVVEAQAGRTELERPGFRGFALAQLALNQFPNMKIAEALVAGAIMDDIPGFVDEPYHPLFSYSASRAMSPALAYLSSHADHSALIRFAKRSLLANRPGSSSLAGRLMYEQDKECLPEALGRSLKVLRRPDAYGDDVSAALSVVLKYGSTDDRRQLAEITRSFKITNPDYANYLRQIMLQYASP